MSLVKVSYKGSFNKTQSFLRKAGQTNDMVRGVAEKYGKMGVEALSQATPVDSGKTAESWDYEVDVVKNTVDLVFTNSNNNHGVYIVPLLQYGHGTRNGGYVQGRDFINPAIQPVYEQMADEVWMEVTSDGK